MGRKLMMNINTGELREFEESMRDDKNWIPVDKHDMTKKQIEELFVSAKDHRSKLGIKRDSAIRKIGRNSPCPCGSGSKYKKCCLFTI